eukprot:7718024-Alexandrium_andersonii.AAC.1
MWSAMCPTSRHPPTGRRGTWTTDQLPCGGSTRKNWTGSIDPRTEPRARPCGQWCGHPWAAHPTPPCRDSGPWP